ncbi:MAG: glucosaminidase domain-containing protein [Candidatus Levybacteria bacterium]|nr:glucosaminidase domain-containing protein [Candidatus Levybacteria bacterium]
MRRFVIILTALFLYQLFPYKVYAMQNASGSSAALTTLMQVKEENSHIRILKKFLEKYSSPLTPYAESFVDNATKYDLDWRLVAAISGLESTFGQQIPYNSYNGWGWGIYGDNIIRFSSWDEGIQTVSKGLRENYINKWKAQDVYEIGKFYASSPTWAVRVESIMNRIQEFELANARETLSLSL